HTTNAIFALESVFGDTDPASLALVLFNAGYATYQIVGGLENAGFDLDADILPALFTDGFSAQDVAAALFATGDATDADTLAADLNTAGYSAADALDAITFEFPGTSENDAASELAGTVGNTLYSDT